MRSHTTAFVMSALIFVSGSVVHAGLMEPISIQRYVWAGGWRHQPYDVRKDGVGVTPFSAQTETPSFHSSQTSSITETTVSVSGSATGFDDYEMGTGGRSLSYFYEKFPVYDQSDYSMSYSWDTWGARGSSTYVSLKGPQGIVFWRGALSGVEYNSAGTWTGSGVISPGNYELTIVSDGVVDFSMIGDSACASFSAEFTLTPEPASAAMFGLAALLVMRRSKGRREI